MRRRGWHVRVLAEHNAGKDGRGGIMRKEKVACEGGGRAKYGERGK